MQASYNATLAATGGTPPYSWSVVAGSLPPGLALGASTGVIAGMPNVSGQYSFTVQVTDPGPSILSAKQTFTISIAAAGASLLQITTSSLPSGQVQASYSATLAATGGTQPYSWSVLAGSLPPGLALDASIGMIAGTATAAGTFSFTVQVIDSSTPTPQTATASLSATLFTPAAGGVFCGATNFGVSLPNCDPNSPNANTVFDTTMPNTSSYTTVVVGASGDLQTALNNASCSPNGTIISVAAGSTFNTGFGSPNYGAGPYQLPNKTCAAGQWIIIQSSAIASLPASGTRVDYTMAANMPKIQTVGGIPALVTMPNANHYRFIGIEFNIPANTDTVNLIDLDPANNTSPPVYGQPAQYIIFDRCYIHGNNEIAHDYRRGIDADSQFFALLDSYVNQFHSNTNNSGSDTQAVLVYRGSTNNVKIVNNYLSSSGENFMSGGVSGESTTPTDFEIRHNHFYKPSNLWGPGSGNQNTIVTKNLFELKAAQRVLLDGNVFDYTWQSAQTGWAILFTSTGDNGPSDVVSDVSFTHNIVRHAASGAQVWNQGGGRNAQNILIQNTVWLDISNATWGDSTGGFWIEDSVQGPNLIYDHNTILETGPNASGVYNWGGAGVCGNHAGWQFTNSIVNRGTLGFADFGCGHSEGSPTINFFTSNPVWGQNVFINSTNLASIYPSGTLWATPDSTTVGFTDNTNCVGGTFTASACALASTSPYHNLGTDGKDIGADIDSINSATAGVVQSHD